VCAIETRINYSCNKQIYTHLPSIFASFDYPKIMILEETIKAKYINKSIDTNSEIKTNIFLLKEIISLEYYYYYFS
jgi:hypothetical protein